MPSAYGCDGGWTDLNFLIPGLATGLEYRKGPFYAADGGFASAAFVVNRAGLPMGKVLHESLTDAAQLLLLGSMSIALFRPVAWRYFSDDILVGIPVYTAVAGGIVG